jgi:hypothetical protein
MSIDILGAAAGIAITPASLAYGIALGNLDFMATNGAGACASGAVLVVGFGLRRRGVP